MSDRLYFDHHSATPPCEAAIERFTLASRDMWASAVAPHRMGQEIAQAFEARLQPIYDLVGASWDHSFFFTSSGAEAIHQLMATVYHEIARKEGKTHVIASHLEDAPTMMALQRLEGLGCVIKIAPVNAKGEVDLAALRELMSPRTALVSVTMAQGLTGVVQPVESIAEICREKQVSLHLEASYAIGKIPLFFDDLGADYLTFSGDKMHSVRSSGGIFARKGRPLTPLLSGNPIDYASLAALSAAATQALLYLDAIALEGARLRDLFESQISQKEIAFADSLRLPNVSTLIFPGVHQESLLYHLNRRGVYASLGGNGPQLLSKLLLSSSIDERRAVSSLSFALARTTTETEVRRAASVIEDTVTFLKQASRDLS